VRKKYEKIRVKKNCWEGSKSLHNTNVNGRGIWG